MSMSLKSLGIGAAVVTFLVMVAITGYSLRAKAAAERDRAVAIANTEAALAEQVRIERDGRAAVLRLQLQLEADSLAQLVLSRESAALRAMNDSLGVVVKALTEVQVQFAAKMVEFDQALVEMTAPNPQGDSMRIAAFREDGPPVEGEIVVEVPVDQSQPIMLTTVLRPTPWTATLQLGCTDRNVASFALDVPTWVPANIALGAVDQNVCNPLPDLSFSGELFRIDASKLIWAGGGAGLMGILVAVIR